MILRLFLVPALIVAVLVALFLVGPALSSRVRGLFGRSAGDSRSAEQFLRDLDSNNPEVRWRAASDLAQVLLRNDELAANVDFSLDLAERLQRTIDDGAAAEKQFASRHDRLSKAEQGKELKQLEPERQYSVFLGACLGNVMVPVGVPLLKQLARQQVDMEPGARAERRRLAVWALANLGENLKRFDRLPAGAQAGVEEQLEAAVRSERRLAWTKPALEHLRQRARGKADTMGVADILVQCAAEDDPSLRFFSAFAMNFWQGTAVEDAAMEKALVRLSGDSGAGEERLVERLDRNPQSPGTRELVKKKGFRVQANATIALARKGSPKVRLDLLELMLKPDPLREVFVLERRDGQEQPNEALVVLTVTDTLKAVAKLRKLRPEMKLDRLLPLVEELAEDPNPAVKTEANQTLLALRR
jgi:hypothetical protein